MAAALLEYLDKLRAELEPISAKQAGEDAQSALEKLDVINDAVSGLESLSQVHRRERFSV